MVLFLEDYRTIRFGFFSEIRFGAKAALRILSKDGKMVPLPFSNLATERRWSCGILSRIPCVGRSEHSRLLCLQVAATAGASKHKDPPESGYLSGGSLLREAMDLAGFLGGFHYTTVPPAYARGNFLSPGDIRLSRLCPIRARFPLRFNPRTAINPHQLL